MDCLRYAAKVTAHVSPRAIQKKSMRSVWLKIACISALIFAFPIIILLDRMWFSSFECENRVPSIYKTNGPYPISLHSDRAIDGLEYWFGTLHSDDDLNTNIPANISRHRYDADKFITVEGNVFLLSWTGMAGTCHSDRTLVGALTRQDELISCNDPSRGWGIKFRWNPRAGVTWMHTAANNIEGYSLLQSGPGLARMCRAWPI